MKAIMFSVSRRRPGCVIIQALGGTVPSKQFHDLFPSETWLTSMGTDMKLYSVTDAELEVLSVVATEAALADRENNGRPRRSQAGDRTSEEGGRPLEGEPR